MSGHGHTEAGPGPGLPATPSVEPLPTEPIAVLTEPAPAPTRRTLDDLAAFVVEQAGRPIDVWAIAALLESGGTRDLDAVEHYGRPNVFALAHAVQARLPEAPPEHVEPTPRPPWRARAKRFARLYGRGSFFVVPLGLQLVGLLVFGVSQFAALDFTLREASVVAIAATAGFVVPAGFVQVTGFLGPLFSEPGKHMITERVMWRIFATGAVVSVLAGLVLWGLATVVGPYQPAEIRIGLAYFLLVALQALSQALLYVLRRYDLMIVTTIAGIATAIVLRKNTGMDVHYVHWAGLGVALATELGSAGWVLRRRAKDTHGPMRLAEMPRARLVLRRAAPFAVYGTLYFAFISADRLVAWADGSHPLPFWFRSEFELGLDWALGGVVLALAFLEITVETFSELLQPSSERYRLSDTRAHNRFMQRFWVRQTAIVAALVAAGAWISIGVAVLLDRLGALGPAAAAFDDHGTHWAYAGGVVGYAFLALGLANSTFLMSLGRVAVVVRILAAAVAANLAVGITLTTVGPYYGAAGGTAAGGLVFAVLSGLAVHRTLRRTDYWTYAAW